MAIYEYRARNREGKIQEGTIETAGEASAMEELSELQYVLISIKKVGEKKPFVAGKRIPQRTLIVFTRQLSTMIHSGIPIVTGITALMEETDNENFRDVLSKIKADIQEGISLSEAFSKHPQIFSGLYISTIAAGEAGGVLDIVLRRLAELLEHEAEIKVAIKSALLYPVLVIATIIAAFFVLTTLVVPQFENVYKSGHVDLPLPTRILIAVNEGIRGYWRFFIPAIIAIVIIVRMYLRTERGQYQWDYIKLKLPVFGELIVKAICSRFAQMLTTLNDAGLPILKSLDVISVTLGNAVFAREIETLRKSVLEGRGIGEPILESEHFPRLVAHMVAIGEKSGALDDMLLSLQRHYDTEVNTTIKNLTALIEPFLMVCLGFVVLFLALAIYLPMWGLITALRGA